MKYDEHHDLMKGEESRDLDEKSDTKESMKKTSKYNNGSV